MVMIDHQFTLLHEIFASCSFREIKVSWNMATPNLQKFQVIRCTCICTCFLFSIVLIHFNLIILIIKLRLSVYLPPNSVSVFEKVHSFVHRLYVYKDSLTWCHDPELSNPFWVGFQMEIWHGYPEKIFENVLIFAFNLFNHDYYFNFYTVVYSWDSENSLMSAYSLYFYCDDIYFILTVWTRGFTWS